MTERDYSADIARLDEADRELARKIDDTERYLRTEMDGKIAAVASGFHADLVSFRDDLKEDIGGIKDSLHWQNRTVGGGLLTFLIFLGLSVIEHWFHL